MKIATVDVGEEKVEIDVDVYGRFNARYDEANVGGDTLQEVKDQLVKMNRKVLDAKAIDVTIIGIVEADQTNFMQRGDVYTSGIGVLNAKFRGKHERTGQWLLISEGANQKERKKFSLSTGGGRDQYQVLCRRVSLEETLEYIRLAKAAEFAKEQLLNWIHQRRLDPKKLNEEV